MALNTFAALTQKSDNRDNIRVTNLALNGKLNSTFEVTLTANTTTTAVTSIYISPKSLLFPMPTTSNAAVELASGTMYFSTVGDGTATITHANNAQTDRSFKVLVIA